MIGRLLRALRSNPHGLEGPLVICYMATAFAFLERGWSPSDHGTVPEHELVEWTRVIFLFLMSLSIDLRHREPEVSADATWALAQVGLSAEQLQGAGRAELERLARLAWDDIASC
jgi:hypothetical protein